MINSKKVSQGVLAPLGFAGGAVGCGIKSGEVLRDDLTLIVSEHPCVSAATFTTNNIKAAPVVISMEHMRSRYHRGIVLNSGNANACTGAKGLAAARQMTRATAKLLEVDSEEILVCSTGRIGVPMPMKSIGQGLEAISLSRESGTSCARAIMTSDTFPKEIALQIKTPDGDFHIGAMAKGAGMIDPNMATMLCVVTTDAVVSRPHLRKILKDTVEESFNRITIDGDMSTNDTVIVLANGMSRVSPDAEVFREALLEVLQFLARQIVLDGEGVSRFVEVHVTGAASAPDARKAAEAVAHSTLVKCAWAGGDPNWGRIMDAVGYSGAKIRPHLISIDYGGLPIVRKGILAPTPWKDLKAVAAQKEFRIAIDLGIRKGTHTVWTTDLTEEYVRLNLGE